MNIDYATDGTQNKHLLKFLKIYNLAQIIDKPTRITTSSSTLIDHIYVTNTNLYHREGVIDPGMSDHGLIFTCRKALKCNRQKKPVIIRNMRHFDADLFNADIAAKD